MYSLIVVAVFTKKHIVINEVMKITDGASDSDLNTTRNFSLMTNTTIPISPPRTIELIMLFKIKLKDNHYEKHEYFYY